MPISATTKAALFEQETEEHFVTLVTINHASLAEPIRVCDDTVNLISRGNTYLAMPFRVNFGEDDPEAVPRTRLRIDNVDRRIVEGVRSVTTSPTVTVEIVRHSDPDTVEMALEDYKVMQAEYNAMEVVADISLENFLHEPYPSAVFDPGRFPGGF